MSARAANAEFALLAQRCYLTERHAQIAAALVIADGRVVAVAPRRAGLRLRRRSTQVIDLGDAVITPGLVDCHTHFFYWAVGRRLAIDLAASRSLEATLRQVQRRARRRVGDWVLGRGFDHNRWGGELPCAADLDAVVSEYPVMIRSHDGHTAWLNTAAVRRVGLTENTPDPPGGRYLRDWHGQPTGIVQESALDLLPDPVRDFARRTDAQARQVVDEALAEACRVAWAHGVVGVHAMDDGVSLGHLQRRHADRRLGVRVVHAVPLTSARDVCELGLRSGLGDDWLRLGGIKIFADGALGSQTAYMFEPYPGRRGYCGVAVTSGDELGATVGTLARHGWAAWIHAIGDRAVHEAIVAISAARGIAGVALPHRIEHAQCVRPADVRRMAQAGIVASVQPCHLLADIPIAERHWPRARRHAYPLRSLIDAGVRLAAGSDVPIEALDPRRSLFAATTRTDTRGEPCAGWFPCQRVTTREIMRAFTRGAAEAAGVALPAGTLVPGAPADLTIWAEDPFRVPPARLLDIGIVGCAVGGQLHLAAGRV
jgi:predicted amidohydrolase YtcJ